MKINGTKAFSWGKEKEQSKILGLDCLRALKARWKKVPIISDWCRGNCNIAVQWAGVIRVQRATSNVMLWYNEQKWTLTEPKDDIQQCHSIIVSF